MLITALGQNTGAWVRPPQAQATTFLYAMNLLKVQKPKHIMGYRLDTMG